MAIELTDTTLNTGSKQLLDQLPDGAGSLVVAMARERGVPLWHAVAGILLEAHTEGRLSAMTIDPAWKVGFKKKLSICQYCKRRFVPKHVNQPYCSHRCGEIVAYEKRLEQAPIPVKPKSDKNIQGMENYLTDLKYRNELEEIIKILKSGVQQQEQEPIRRNSGGTDLGGIKRSVDTVSSRSDDSRSGTDDSSTKTEEPKIPAAKSETKSESGNRAVRA